MKPPILILLLILTTPWLIQAREQILWAIAKAWPIPLPVHSTSKVLPVFFSTSCELGLPCVNLDPDTAQYSATNISLNGALCFSLINNSNPCIWLKNGSIGNWLDPLTNNQISSAMLTEALSQFSTGASSGSGTGTNGTKDVNITTFLMLMEGLRPSNSRFSQENSTARQVLPYCAPNRGYPPHWTPCQSPDHKLKQIAPGFEFTPPLGKYQYNLTQGGSQRTGSKNTWPWFQWVLSNERGAFTSLEPFAVLQNLCIRLLNVSGTRDEKGPSLKNLSIHKALNNLTVPASPVCLKAPFFFLLSNATDATKEVISCNSTDVSCIASQCWNGSANTAVVMRIPMYVPIPVKVDTGTFPITEIIRTKRDFGITAALVTAITLSAAAATTAAVAMAAQVQSAETVNDIVEKTATTLTTLRSIDGHLKAGILTVNQRVDLLQEQVDDLVTLTSIGCIHSFSSLCITSRMANNFTENSNLSWQLSAYLQGNWSQQFENLTDTLTQQIIAVNATRLSLPTVNTLLTTLKRAFSLVKEWAGIGVMFSMMLLAIFVCLWTLATALPTIMNPFNSERIKELTEELEY
ncbi:uncharacterized protein LOC118238940 [Cricetulus griseus]|uniref:Uncharacterized protein LOC118238940 n=1 Tax=Cricetulus griseus TaxID=10029 RepID=A0A9J7H192_CRIGR|nr:uncharacterized protein LOC118238940 [Cricetulus griseus]